MNAFHAFATQCLTIAAGMLFAAPGHAQINPGAAANAPKSKDSTLAYTPDPITTTSRLLSGKLFFSDAKRAQLDHARKVGILVVEDEIVQRTDVLNGFVRRSDGSTTYWVNGGGSGEARYAKSPADNVMSSSSMVGVESKFILAGSNLGAEGAAVGAKAMVEVKATTGSSKKKILRHKTVPKIQPLNKISK